MTSATNIPKLQSNQPDQKKKIAPVGYVQSVSATSLTALINPVPKDRQKENQNVGIGTMLKMRVGNSLVYGTVTHLTVSDPGLKGSRQKLMEIDLLGEALPAGDGLRKFHQGISVYPLLDDPLWLANTGDIACVYESSDSSVRVGSIHQADRVPARLLTDEFLSKHFAILGSTGSGKSCTTALILRSILNAHPSGHIIMLDPHNEYSSAFSDMAEIFNAENLQIPHWLLNLEELSALLVAADGAARQTEINILKKVLKQCRELYSEQKGNAGDSLINDKISHITVDSPIPYSIKEFIRQMNLEMGQLGNSSNVGPYLQILARLESLTHDVRYGFMFSRRHSGDTLQDLIESLLRIPVEGKPVAILDLSGMPSEVVDVVVSVLARLIFDFALWSHHSPRVPVLLVCEEAHRYVPGETADGFAPTRQALERIAKEGRKYGVSLGLITQRPSELSSTILSQCGTLVTLRMSNEKDQQFIAKSLPDSSGSLLSILPALRPQEAVIVGQGVTVPMRVRFDDLAEEHRPRSTSASFSASWKDEHARDEFVEKTIGLWRNQKQ